MNKEVYHEGWLIKSPPIKIWRARWRRRWFTLKQGELPGQFFLEYYTDRNCRKLKGVIDLDQCEQVDAGLSLMHRKIKFQHMFDVKTPHRIYYLAAESEEDMRGWVNCICQVCGLQDLSKTNDDRQYQNIGPDAINDAPVHSLNVNNMPDAIETAEQIQASTIAQPPAAFVDPPRNNTYQNDSFMVRQSEYSNRETIMCEAKLIQQQLQRGPVTANRPSNPFHQQTAMTQAGSSYYSFGTPPSSAEISAADSGKNTIERSQSLKSPASAIVNHTRTLSLNENPLTTDQNRHTRKIPENLNLNESGSNLVDNSEPSPSLSTCSGPYIPISECYSGSPGHLNNEPPMTPLNSLDPRFYDTPRSHINIGLNLTNDQQYSPKRNNCAQQVQRPRSGRSSPTDSESVFTDDDEWTQPEKTQDRHTRPSDSSVENEAIGFTYLQRFSKVPEDGARANGIEEVSESQSVPPRPPKRIGALILDSNEKQRDTQSDTENASPAIGPKDRSCVVEESYDIPRSHRLPYQLLSPNDADGVEYANFVHSSSPGLPVEDRVSIASSTPNLVSLDEASSEGGTLGRMRQTWGSKRSHFYTNAAPTKIEGNVFRYDFIEQDDAPKVDRKLKPKNSTELVKLSENDEAEEAEDVVPEKQDFTQSPPILPPNVDRKLKPTTPKLDTASLRRKVRPTTITSDMNEMNVSTASEEVRVLSTPNSGGAHGSSAVKSSPVAAIPNSLSPLSNSKSDDKLQYLDLDHTSPQKTLPRSSGSNTAMTLYNQHRHSRGASVVDVSGTSGVRPLNESRTVYKTVDFLKTKAFQLTRQDAEIKRNRLKD